MSEDKKGQVIDVGQQDISETLENKKQVIKNTVAKNANKQEFEMFMHLAKTYQLDPFQKEIFFWKYGGDTTIMTSRDGYLKIANRHPQFDGLVSDVVREKDNFEKTEQGVKHQYGTKRGTITGAYAMVYRKDRSYPVYVYAPYGEYKANKKVWKQYPSAMILKVAESMALKRAFSISGLVSRSEMHAQEEPQNDYKTYPEQEQKPPKQESEEDVTDVTPDTNGSIADYEIPFGKHGGKKLSDIPNGYLEWVRDDMDATNEAGEQAQEKITQYLSEDKEEKGPEPKEERKLTEREKEMKELIDGDKELRKEMFNYMSEYDTVKLDGLDEQQFNDLVSYFKNIKKPDDFDRPENIADKDLAAEVAAEMEDDDEFDTPF